MENKSTLQIFTLSDTEDFAVPILPAKVKAGGYGSFESPALDFPEDSINLLGMLIKDKETTFFGRVTGDSMNGIGIYDQDILIIQKGLFPRENDVVAVFYHGEFYTKVYQPKYKGETRALEAIRLKSENPVHEDIYITEDTDFELWGVVTWNLHKLRK